MVVAHHAVFLVIFQRWYYYHSSCIAVKLICAFVIILHVDSVFVFEVGWDSKIVQDLLACFLWESSVDHESNII